MGGHTSNMNCLSKSTVSNVRAHPYRIYVAITDFDWQKCSQASPTFPGMHNLGPVQSDRFWTDFGPMWTLVSRNSNIFLNLNWLHAAI